MKTNRKIAGRAESAEGNRPWPYLALGVRGTEAGREAAPAGGAHEICETKPISQGRDSECNSSHYNELRQYRPARRPECDARPVPLSRVVRPCPGRAGAGPLGLFRRNRPACGAGGFVSQNGGGTAPDGTCFPSKTRGSMAPVLGFVSYCLWRHWGGVISCAGRGHGSHGGAGGPPRRGPRKSG